MLIAPGPSQGDDPTNPLAPGNNSRSAAWGLVRMTGLDPDTYLLSFERRNLLPRFLGRTGKGDRFPMKWARKETAKLIPQLHGRVVVLVGPKVARAINFNHIPAFTWEWMAGAMMAWIPNTSGACHWWNDPANAEQGQRFLAGLGQRALELAIGRDAA